MAPNPHSSVPAPAPALVVPGLGSASSRVQPSLGADTSEGAILVSFFLVIY